MSDIDTKRLRELADRLVASGPKASRVSASECHEIREGVHELINTVEGSRAAANRLIKDAANEIGRLRDQLARAQAAAQVYAERVDALGLAADDNDPKVMATAGPIGEAQADLFAELDLIERDASGRVGVKPPTESVEQLRAERDSARMLARVRGEERDRLATRRDELLALVASISQSTPLDEEVKGALNQRGALLAEVGTLRARVADLERQLNTPHTADFVESVRIEAAHQVARWGVEHDARKSIEDWAALFVRLLGKMVDAHWNGDIPKLFHHVVTLAAVAANCHARLSERLDARGRAKVAEANAAPDDGAVVVTIRPQYMVPLATGETLVARMTDENSVELVAGDRVVATMTALEAAQLSLALQCAGRDAGQWAARRKRT